MTETMKNQRQTGTVPATDFGLRPGDFPLGSIESRAAMRLRVEAEQKQSCASVDPYPSRAEQSKLTSNHFPPAIHPHDRHCREDASPVYAAWCQVEEKERYARDGTLPDWFQQVVATPDNGKDD